MTTTIQTIIINILHRDEDATHYFQRAKYFKVRAIESHVEAIEAENWDGLEHARKFNAGYKRNMRKAMERVTYLTGIDEETAKATMVWYATEVVNDALIDSVTL